MHKQLPSSVSIETNGGVATPLIFRGELLPIQTRRNLSSIHSNQSQSMVHFLYGDNKNAADNVTISKFILGGLQPYPEAVPPAGLDFNIDTDLIMNVTFWNRTTRTSKFLGEFNLAILPIPKIIDPLPEQPNNQNSDSNAANAADFFDIFGEVFNPMFTKHNQNSERTEESFSNSLTLSVKEAKQGEQKELDLNQVELCASCNGTGAELDSTIVICYPCKGTGKIRIERQTIMGPMVQETICVTCNGHGKAAKQKCKTCHGEKIIKKNR